MTPPTSSSQPGEANSSGVQFQSPPRTQPPTSIPSSAATSCNKSKLHLAITPTESYKYTEANEKPPLHTAPIRRTWNLPTRRRRSAAGSPAGAATPMWLRAPTDTPAELASGSMDKDHLASRAADSAPEQGCPVRTRDSCVTTKSAADIRRYSMVPGHALGFTVSIAQSPALTCERSAASRQSASSHPSTLSASPSSTVSLDSSSIVDVKIP